MCVGELEVLDRAVLDVVADPLAKVLAHLQLLVARGRHRCLEREHMKVYEGIIQKKFLMLLYNTG